MKRSKPRSGDTILSGQVSPLRGLGIRRDTIFRGLTPTAKLLRRCAAVAEPGVSRAAQLHNRQAAAREFVEHRAKFQRVGRVELQ